MTGWTVERIVHFGPGDLLVDGLAHFGFHTADGRYFAVDHRGHAVGLVGADGRLEVTIAERPLDAAVPNIAVPLANPMYVDVLADQSIVVSNFGDARLYRIDLERRTADLLVEGTAIGMRDMGNCVVDRDGTIWVNEVTGCRLWQFDPGGRVLLTLGDGRPGFEPGAAAFEAAAFSRIYDIRRGPDGRIYVLDSGNFAVRVVEPGRRRVVTIAGTGGTGYTGDGEDARRATFGSDPSARYDGPISLSLDNGGAIYIGDRFNHVVRRIDPATGLIDTVAGRPDADARLPNRPAERDPARLNLPEISSMDFGRGRLFVPTDLADDRGDLIVLRPPRERPRRLRRQFVAV